MTKKQKVVFAVVAAVVAAVLVFFTCWKKNDIAMTCEGDYE